MTQGMEELGRGTLLWKLSREVLGKDSTDYIPTGEHPETDLLFLKLNLLLDRGDFNKAEDMLFEAVEEELPGMLELAVDVYARLNQLPEAALQAGNYSKEEIREGLLDLMDQFGIRL